MWKGVRGSVLLLLASTLVGVVGIEIIMRVLGLTYPIFYRPDPYCGTALREGAEGMYEGETRNYVRINRDGLRDREHRKSKPPGVFRIAVLGDSYAEALQIPMEQSFWWILGDDLSLDASVGGRKYEVINFGVGGYGTAQELQALRHRVWEYAPDMVLLAVCTGNDIRNNSRTLQRDDRMPYFIHMGKELMLDDTFLGWYRSRQGRIAGAYYAMVDHSCLLRCIRTARYGIDRMRWARERAQLASSAGLAEVGLDEIVYRDPADGTWGEAWRVTDDLLVLMNREVRAKGAVFVVVTLSNGDQVNPDVKRRSALEKELGVGDLFYPERRISAVGDHNGFPVLTLAPLLRQYVDETGAYLHGFGQSRGTGHWNVEGHRVAAHLISKALRKLLKQSDTYSRHEGMQTIPFREVPDLTPPDVQ
jgi:hypothetical protein